MSEIGNVIPAPGFHVYGEVEDDEILFSYAGLVQKGVTLAAGQGILPTGTVLGQVTATKRYVVYDNGAGDGSEVAVGVLRKSVDTGAADDDELLANIVLAGNLKLSKLSGLDANAITDLGGKSIAARDLFKF